MAFTGTPVVTRVSDSLARISGVSLGPDTSGEIGVAGSGAEVELPQNWSPYSGDAAGDGVVDLVESCEVSFNFLEEPEDPQDHNIYISKSNGGDPLAFRIGIEQPTSGEIGSGAEMEIYVRFH